MAYLGFPISKEEYFEREQKHFICSKIMSVVDINYVVLQHILHLQAPPPPQKKKNVAQIIQMLIMKSTKVLLELQIPLRLFQIEDGWVASFLYPPVYSLGTSFWAGRHHKPILILINCNFNSPFFKLLLSDF